MWVSCVHICVLQTDNNLHTRRRKFQYELGILYLPYRPSLWFFEIFDMLHKLTLTALVPLMPPGFQLPAGMMCAFVYLSTIALTDPYYINKDLTLHVLAQVEIILVFMAIYVFNDSMAWQVRTTCARTRVCICVCVCVGVRAVPVCILGSE
jgi:hypothetical protein